MTKHTAGPFHVVVACAIALAVAVGTVTSCRTPRLVNKDLPPRPVSLEAAFRAMPSASRAQVSLLHDNIDAWVARMRAIDAATKSIDAQYFILEPDVFGLAFLGLLAEKARAGVHVRLMLDARGSFTIIRGEKRPLLQAVVKAGALARVYNPIALNVTSTVARGDLRAVTASNHDKLLIVDKKHAISGGRNLSRDYLADAADHPGAFIDMDAALTGPAARRLTEAFSSEFRGTRSTRLWVEPFSPSAEPTLALVLDAVRRFMASQPLTPDELAGHNDDTRQALAAALTREVLAVRAAPTKEALAVLQEATLELARLPRLRGALFRPTAEIAAPEVEVRVLDTHSAEGPTTRNQVNDSLLAAVQAAEHHVVIQSPYFILTDRGMRALEEASARGVRITILTNSPASSDSPITQAAFMKQWPQLLQRAPTARIFAVGVSRVMHAKTGVMDGQLAFVGSYNLDPLSAGVNGEVVNALWSKPLAQELASLIDARIAAGAPHVFEYRIARDDSGRPVLKDGAPVVAFGPADHCTQEQLEAAQRLESLLPYITPLL